MYVYVAHPYPGFSPRITKHMAISTTCASNLMNMVEKRRRAECRLEALHRAGGETLFNNNKTAGFPSNVMLLRGSLVLQHRKIEMPSPSFEAIQIRDDANSTRSAYQPFPGHCS